MAQKLRIHLRRQRRRQRKPGVLPDLRHGDALCRPWAQDAADEVPALGTERRPRRQLILAGNDVLQKSQHIARQLLESHP